MYVYTNAPPRYDYSCMEDTGEVTEAGFRVLVTEDRYRYENFQKPRYRSGLYQSYTEVEYNERMNV